MPTRLGLVNFLSRQPGSTDPGTRSKEFVGEPLEVPFPGKCGGVGQEGSPGWCGVAPVSALLGALYSMLLTVGEISIFTEEMG